MVLKVTCAIIINGSTVLCAQRGASMSLPLQWEFPGGKIEADESAEACIQREIKEELNLDIRILERGPSALHPYKEGQLLELIPFVCTVADGELQLREHAQARWCTPQEMDSLQWAEADLEILAWWKDNFTRIKSALETA